MAIRLHLFAVPHTITSDEYSHCAFTGKVKRFSPMMRSLGLGYEVYHYGVAGADSGATRDIDVLSQDEWHELRIASLMYLEPKLNRTQAMAQLEDKTHFFGKLGDVSTPLYAKFNERLREILPKHYRSCKTDIVCLPFGYGHREALVGLNVVKVESGIGYYSSCEDYRIFESYAVMHITMGAQAHKVPRNYWFVIPNYYDLEEFYPQDLGQGQDQSARPLIGFLGRISNTKGCHIIVEIARRMPEVDFIICGQGDPAPYCVVPNLIYKAPICGAERRDYMNSLVALLTPSQFIEPFCGVCVEAQLCGTPVIAQDCGAFSETIEHGKTGLLCHTLADYCQGIRLAIDGHFDRSYIAGRAAGLYDMYKVAHRYDMAFKTILDVHNGNRGWYAAGSHIVAP